MSCMQPQAFSSRQPIIDEEKEYTSAAVAADSYICSQVGRYILAKGGSVVDCAIATLVCAGLASCHCTGLGGGFLATVYQRESKAAFALDARDYAPLRAHEKMVVQRSDSSMKGCSMTVPTELAGYKALHERFGKLPWKDLFEPTIKLCFEGFPIEKGLRVVLVKQKYTVMNTADLREMFVNPVTSELYNIGDTFKNPKLGRTLMRISEDKDTLYSGSLADDVVKEIQDGGPFYPDEACSFAARAFPEKFIDAAPTVRGIVTKEDLENCSVKWREPVEFSLRDDLTLHSLPPPSSGAIVGFILKVLEGYKFPPNAMTVDPLLTHHRIVEASKFAFAKRYQLGDMDFVDVSQVFNDLLSAEYAEATRARITDDHTHPPEYYGRYGPHFDTGTSHLSVVAPNGDAVSVTGSINHYFGCGVVGSKTGIIYNCGMADFTPPAEASNHFYELPPSPQNYIHPGKRPMSSMAPIIVSDDVTGDVRLVTGASGGSRIISQISNVVLRVLYFNETLKQATLAPRIYHQWLPDHITYEDNFPETLLKDLEAKGHKLQLMNRKHLGPVVQSIRRHNGKIYAYSDPRKGGCPDGY